MKRTELQRTPFLGTRPVSAKQAERLRRAKPEKETAIARDYCLCRLRSRGGCHGPIHVHHLLKQSAGTLEVGAPEVGACDFHNGLIEDEPALFEALGLVCRDGDLDGCWQRMHAAGLAVEPWPSPAPNAPIADVRGYGSLCATCASVGGSVMYSGRWFCPGCAEERFG